MSRNAQRRQLTKAQLAMIAVRSRMFRMSNFEERKWTNSSLARSFNVTDSAITAAQQVLDHAPDLVDAVVVGDKKLDAAHKVAEVKVPHHGQIVLLRP